MDPKFTQLFIKILFSILIPIKKIVTVIVLVDLVVVNLHVMVGLPINKQTGHQREYPDLCI